MLNTLIKAIAILVLPTAVFFVGVWAMNEVSDRQHVYDALESESVHECDRIPLNQRFGYSVEAVDRHWGPIVQSPKAYKAELHFLEIDLVFPFFYGAALVSSLLMARASLGRRFSPVWAIAPVAIGVIADWTENLVQLSSLRNYATEGVTSLSNAWIQLASGATFVKLLFVYGTLLFIIVLVVAMFLRTPEPA